MKKIIIIIFHIILMVSVILFTILNTRWLEILVVSLFMAIHINLFVYWFNKEIGGK